MNLDLINDFLDYGVNNEGKIKAKRVMYLCLKNQKYDLAKKIKRKYNLYENEDFITSFSLVLLVSKNLLK